MHETELNMVGKKERERREKVRRIRSQIQDIEGDKARTRADEHRRVLSAALPGFDLQVRPEISWPPEYDPGFDPDRDFGSVHGVPELKFVVTVSQPGGTPLVFIWRGERETLHEIREAFALDG